MTQTPDDMIEEGTRILMKTYAPQPFVMERGEGVYAYDTEGKRYLDFACGIAVASLGHAPKAVIKTITEQAGRLMAVQASYATPQKLEAARLLTEKSCFDSVYFCNSGTESVEAALKLGRKWAYENKGETCNEIIAFRKSFHGRTYGSASITEKRHTQRFFDPYLPGIQWADFNDIDSVKAVISDKTAAIIIEPVQGEGGLVPAHPCFLRDLRKLCDENKIVLIFDEVQAGMGRLGTLFAYESFTCCDLPNCNAGQNKDETKARPIEPDIACYAKGLGSGFPVGCTMAKRDFDVFVPGTHGATYSGNPLATAVATTVLKELTREGFLDHVRKTGNYFVQGLQKLQRDSNKITDIRGLGLMIGVDTTIDIKTLIPALQTNGLLTTQAGDSTLRLTPPLITQEDHIDEALDILAKTLKEND